jgi:hypothetical protein
MDLPHRRFLPAIAGALWAMAVASGMTMLWAYAEAPGAAATPPAVWPRDSHVRPSAERATLIMLAHPHCPCTRASIEELDRLMAQAGDRLAVDVLFVTPPDAGDSWDATDLWRSAAAIPGVTVLDDVDGIEARRFGALTSGQVLVYDAAGRLRFSGGITAARGHAGDNAGRSAIVALLDGAASASVETPVFGCSLVDDRRS